MNDNSEAHNLGQILRLLHLAPVTFRPGLPYRYRTGLIFETEMLTVHTGPVRYRTSFGTCSHGYAIVPFSSISRQNKQKKMSTLDVVMETSLVQPVETKQVQKVDLNWTCFSVYTRTERYDIVPLLFTRERNGTISYRFNFWFTFPYRPISGPVLERTA